MDALLINVPTKNSYEASEPLGLYYTAATSIESGFEVEILDAVLNQLSLEEIATYVAKHDYSLIGLSMPFQLYLPTAIELIKMLRERGVDCHITLGGVSPSLCYRELLSRVPEMDSVVIGEGEYAFRDLLAAIKTGKKWQTTPGLAFRDDGLVKVIPPRLIENLDDLPFPRLVDYGKKPYNAYQVLIASSRGCHASCAFCSVHSFLGDFESYRWRGRSPGNVIKEMLLLSELGVENIRFADDNFFGPGRSGINRAHGIAARMQAEGLRFQYSFEARANEMREEVLEPLLESGLRKVFVGIESINPETLKFFRKGARVEENMRAIETLERIGIDYEIGYILFQPDSTLDELSESLRFLRDLPSLKPFHLSKLAVYHGTPLQKSMAAEGLLSGDFLCYNYGFSDPRVGEIWKIAQTVADLTTSTYLTLMNLRESMMTRDQSSAGSNYAREAEKNTYSLYKKFDDIQRRAVGLLIRAVDEKKRSKPELTAPLGLTLLEIEIANLKETIARLAASFEPASSITKA